ncbi:MAG TPA: hypothetical protein VN833_06055 [Candidatus Acidoferrales bacterium]|nr:hypothetical protein [Candidatus Acidoferrales bacterium]
MVKEGPGAEVLEFRLAHLEVRRRTMQAGAESDYLSRVLANRTRCRTVDSWAAPCLSGAGARLYLKLLTPLIECTVEGMNLPFSFDTGASGTALFVRYYHLFRTGSKSSKGGKSRSFGAGGLVERKISIQPQVDLGVGDKTVTLKKVPMLSLVRAMIPTTRGSRARMR